VLRDFAELWPERFTNVTNGVTPRRFVALANPTLSALLTEAIGAGWINDLERLAASSRTPTIAGSSARWRAVKHATSERLARWLDKTHGLALRSEALLDVQCKRIHEYKRQHLNLLHAIALYARLGDGADDGPCRARSCSPARPRRATRAAKLIIRLAHAIADAIGTRACASGCGWCSCPTST
jgi:starch phosphorylase